MRQMPWHDRPVAAVCLVVACLAWFFLSLGKLSDAASFGSETYSISIRMDGTDPKSIVRDITVALEDAIAEVG